jgi:hypothetical protein
VAQGKGLLTPQQFVFKLTARPGTFDLNRRQAALQRLRYGWCHAGLSDKVRKALPFYKVRNNFVVAKKPLPLSHKLFSPYHYFFNSLFEIINPIPQNMFLKPLT